MKRLFLFIISLLLFFSFSNAQSVYKLKKSGLRNFERKSYKSCLNKFLKAEELGDTLIGSKLIIGLCLVTQGEQEKANNFFSLLEHFDVVNKEFSLIKFNNQHVSACYFDALDSLIWMTDYEISKYRYKRAANCARYLAENNLSDSYGLDKLSEIYFTTKKFDLSIQHCEHALKNAGRFMDFDSSFFLSRIGNCYNAKKEYSIAITYFDKILEMPNLSKITIESAYINKIYALINMKNYSEAIRICEEAKLTTKLFSKNRRYFRKKAKESRQNLRYQKKNSK